HEVLASAGGRYYSAFIGTTDGWRHPAGTVPTPDEVAAHLDAVRSRDGYRVPLSLGDDVKAGLDPSHAPEQAAQGYFDAVLRKDAEALRALFTEDAELDVPGARRTGNEAISEFYRGVFAAGTPTPSPGPFMVRGDCVAVQIALRHEGQDRRMADFFTVTADGRISRLLAYQAL
ncbi:MAG TPA: nuclear transport factor 2 family protein, partial [Streptomyces sp.]